mmetsp:Transcript_12119/g.17768  ORF Transcript_12119/g.17768 Transcript_12119/m.17768 type:complete len:337 (-) Transcript_12119:183-1193(-)
MKDWIGWFAALISILAFGSFGAPIKSPVVQQLQVDPLVFQSYKTFLCFVTSWPIFFFGGIPFSFTSWGIVSGFFWVPGGIATVYAIQSAGLAVSIGVGNSCIVLVSFIWGIFIFKEDIYSKIGACVAIIFMMAGIVGMSVYSAAKAPEYEECDDEEKEEVNDGENNSNNCSSNNDAVSVFGCKLKRRTLGIMAAVFNGTWGGSIMVPMHFSNTTTSGLGYVISFAIGASIVTLLCWMLVYLSGHPLPSLHIRQIWRHGCLSGLLWSIGNVGSMISVQYLGEGVGYSVIQAAMLVAGLWGIFFFREITQSLTIIKWFLSAALTVSGILLLSYEHEKA